jgi:monoamine oxidase
MLADRQRGAAARNGAPRLVIIGAGFGGLSCAYQLQRTGALVTVLEARQRLGGQVHSLYSLLPGKKVEAGAEWIGLNHPTWLAYAKQFGLSLNELPEGEEEESPILLNGRRLIDKEVAQLWTSLDQVLQSMNGDARTINRQQPWLSANAKQLDGQSLAQASQGWPGSPLAKQAAMAKIANGMNCLPDRFSYLAIWNQLAFLSRGSRRLTEITLYQLVTGGVLELNYNKETLSIAESLTQKLSELDNLVVYRFGKSFDLKRAMDGLRAMLKTVLFLKTP